MNNPNLTFPPENFRDDQVLQYLSFFKNIYQTAYFLFKIRDQKNKKENSVFFPFVEDRLSNRRKYLFSLNSTACSRSHKVSIKILTLDFLQDRFRTQ